MRKIALACDSSADLSTIQAENLNVHVLRMPVIVDEIEYIENETIELEEFIQKMKDGATVSTSQPSFGSLTNFWAELLNDYEEVVYIPLSSGLSGSYNSAVLASKEFDGKVTVIDAKFACAPFHFLLSEVNQLIDKGYTGKKIKEHIESKSFMYAILMPEDLVYLKRGGRISAAAAALGNMLKIVPLLTVEDGKIDVYDKVRTTKKAHKMSFEKILDVENTDDYYFVVLYGGEESEGSKELFKQVQSRISNKNDLYYGPIRPVILAHVGPGTVAIGHVKKTV